MKQLKKVWLEIKWRWLSSGMLHCVISYKFPSEMLVYFYKTTWCNILEDGHLHIHCHENLKSCNE
jgi:hypothetical protein